MRVLVCGSRGWQNYLEIHNALKGLVIGQRWEHRPDRIIVIHGGARGADLMAHRAAEALNCPVEEYPADWDKHGRAAGPIRNKQMLDTGIDLVLAFTTAWPPTPGTANMIKIAAEKMVPVRLYIDTNLTDHSRLLS